MILKILPIQVFIESIVVPSGFFKKYYHIIFSIPKRLLYATAIVRYFLSPASGNDASVQGSDMSGPEGMHSDPVNAPGAIFPHCHALPRNTILFKTGTAPLSFGTGGTVASSSLLVIVQGSSFVSVQEILQIPMQYSQKTGIPPIGIEGRVNTHSSFQDSFPLPDRTLK
jgi:hypothetical protein